MGIKFKKISQTEGACIYAMIEEANESERQQLISWLDVHCPDSYNLSKMHLILSRHNELFFELTYITN